MMWDNDGGWGMHSGGWIALLLVFALVAIAVAAVVLAVGRNNSPGESPRPDPGGPDAEADRILQRRFAAGEIDEDEYRRRRELLHHGP